MYDCFGDTLEMEMGLAIEEAEAKGYEEGRAAAREEAVKCLVEKLGMTEREARAVLGYAD